MNQDTYLTLSGIASGQYSEKRSRFLAWAHAVQDGEEVRTLVADYRRRYHDARHVCWAFRLPDGVSRSTDDGEPAGTGGRPILTAIEHAGMHGVAVVVVRYYGGVNLGTGPLSRAYRTAADEALAAAQTVEHTIEEVFTHTFPYEKMNAVMRIVKASGARVVAQQCDTQCAITLAVPRSQAEEIKRQLKE